MTMAIEDFTTDPPPGAEAPLPIRSTPCCANLRRLTVTRLANGKPELVPQLRVNGQWLYQAGFPIGSKVQILVSQKRLIIELIENATENRVPRLPRTIGPKDCIY
jgi:hypothetical protein